jgi:hypothetical protein
MARTIIPTNGEALTVPASGDIYFEAGVLYIGTGGSLKCTLQEMTRGTYVTFTNIPNGTNLPWSVKAINNDASATTCDNIILGKV